MRLVRWIDDQRRLDWWLSAIVLVIAAGDAWASRHQINPDGISYLDLGNVVFAHGIRAGANIAWSPAYTWLVGAALDFAHPSRPHELLVVMVVNLVIVVVVLVSFAWWLRELFELLRRRGVRLVISEQVLRVLAYGVVAWALLSQVTAGLVTPDMLLAAVGFAATAALVRIARLGGSPAAWIGLGVLLGVGYLVKAGFLVPAVVACAACVVLTAGAGTRRVGALVLTLGACVCVAAPFVAVLSSKEGRLELGDYGTLNYAWDVDGVTRYLNWTGGDGDFGRPVHPTLVAVSPSTFSYAAPAGGSIPVWYDPAYWYEGVQPRLVVGGQISAIASSIKTTLRAIVVGPLILLLIPLLLLWRARRRDRGAPPDERAPPDADRPAPWPRRAVRAAADHAYLALALAGIVTYLPLLVVTRYIAAYIAILVVAAFLLACGRLGQTDLGSRVVDRVALATLLVAAVTFLYSAARPVDHVGHQLAGGDAPGTSDLRVARALRQARVGAGDSVVFVGESDGVLSAYWARLDGDRVVGNVEDANGAFWKLPIAAQAGRLALLQKHTGARAVVTDESGARVSPGWVRIAGTGDSYTLLDGARG